MPRTRPSSALRSLHHILELQECLVGRLGILSAHLGHHVGAHILAQAELVEGVVHVHGLGGRHGRNHVANGGVGGSVVRQGGHSLAVNALDGLAVGQHASLQGLRVHRGAHDQHLVDGLQHLQGLGGGQHSVDAVSPVDLLQQNKRPEKSVIA